MELRAWPQQTWTTVGVSPEAALLLVVDRWRAGQVKGLELGGASAEEARALGRPPMGYVRAQLRERLAGDQPPVPTLAAPHQPPPLGRDLPLTTRIVVILSGHHTFQPLDEPGVEAIPPPPQLPQFLLGVRTKDVPPGRLLMLDGNRPELGHD